MTKEELTKLLKRGPFKYDLCAICERDYTTIYDRFGQVVKIEWCNVALLKESSINMFIDWYIDDQKRRRRDAKKRT